MDDYIKSEAAENAAVAGKKILDVTCGSRTIWFNKTHPAVIYCDRRREDFDLYFGKARTNLYTCSVDPDVQCDFTDLPFDDDTFSLVVFDPPHLTGAKETSWLVKKYGKLDENWSQMLHDGFAECMRVLKPDGVLIFKWSEYNIPADRVWRAIGQKPLFGHHSGKNSKTFWACFMKLNEKGQATRKIDASPTVDAVSVVRCKDCCYCYKEGERAYCMNAWPAPRTTPEDYCSHGRKSNEAN